MIKRQRPLPEPRVLDSLLPATPLVARKSRANPRLACFN